MKYEHVFRVVLVGESGVGKSAILDSFPGTSQQEDATHKWRTRTIRVEKTLLEIMVCEVQNFSALAFPNHYFTGVNGIMVVYDGRNEKAFLHLVKWLKITYLYCSSTTGRIIVANNRQKPVNHSEAKSLAEKWEVPFVEASIYDFSTMENAFRILAHEMLTKGRWKNLSTIKFTQDQEKTNSSFISKPLFKKM